MECLQCGKTYARRQSLWRHKKTCQASRKKDNEGDAVSVNEKDSQTVTASETRPKKRKADCLEESKDIPKSFKERGFSDIKTLPNETFLRILEITYKNQAHILNLEERFHNDRYNIYKLPQNKQII